MASWENEDSRGTQSIEVPASDFTHARVSSTNASNDFGMRNRRTAVRVMRSNRSSRGIENLERIKRFQSLRLDARHEIPKRSAADGPHAHTPLERTLSSGYLCAVARSIAKPARQGGDIAGPGSHL